MISQFLGLVACHLRGIVRDRILFGVFGMAVFLILLVPALSSFSMRQVQELSITLSLSVVSGILLVVTLLLGSSSIWRDIERRYTSSLLSLPLSRTTYLLSKFASLAVFQLAAILILGAGCAVVILLATATYPSEIPIHWGNIALALGGMLTKYLLLAAVALLLSALSTSFYLPFFGALAIYFAGSASQEVYEYVTGEFGKAINPASTLLIKSAYYLIPNFSAFDFQVQAVYALPVSTGGLLLTALYAAVYIAILLVLAVLVFDRRELP